jgi:imidazolonepropionase-like amidohydrolase
MGAGEHAWPLVTRRRFLQVSAASAVTLAACGPDLSRVTPAPTPRPTGEAPETMRPDPTATAAPTATPGVQPVPTAGHGGRTLYRDAALSDGRSDQLQVGVSVLVTDGAVAWTRPSDAEENPGPAEGLEVVDASGSTIVPGMVDCHSHLTLPGGAHWIDRGLDPPARLLEYAEHNARLMRGAGVFWARDVGAPVGDDPVDGRRRALSLGLRERWQGRPEYPSIRAAGSWVTREGTLPAGLTVEAADADELLAAAIGQLDDGADFVKLYLDGPDAATAPWSAAEVRRVVDAAGERGARVTAHAGRLSGARVAAEAGVHSIEHGFELDGDVARLMAERGIALVSTLAVMHSWLSFGRTTRLDRFAGEQGRRRIEDRLATAGESVRLAHAAGVAVCAGTDFGGGSTRANQLAWEVESLVSAGLEPWQALAAATWRGGELLGEPDAGALREGGPADFFLVHGDPLSDPAALWRVWRVSR